MARKYKNSAVEFPTEVERFIENYYKGVPLEKRFVKSVDLFLQILELVKKSS